MILEDIAQVVYAPAKTFKKVVENPKYLAALIVLILFIGLQFGYEYVQLSKTYVENTSPLKLVTFRFLLTRLCGAMQQTPSP